MTTKKELLKSIVQIVKQTEGEVAALKEGRSFEKPIENDLVKTKKAMAYEIILSEIRKYQNKKKERAT
jgi:hypothetical protein